MEVGYSLVNRRFEKFWEENSKKKIFNPNQSAILKVLTKSRYPQSVYSYFVHRSDTSFIAFISHFGVRLHLVTIPPGPVCWPLLAIETLSLGVEMAGRWGLVPESKRKENGQAFTSETLIRRVQSGFPSWWVHHGFSGWRVHSSFPC